MTTQMETGQNKRETRPKRRAARVVQGSIGSEIQSRAKRVPSDYSDEFDYSVFDQLAKKFGSKQPRGGVVLKTTFRLANHHSSCSKCHYAFELDTYGRGCTHNCSYCYALELLTGHGYWNRPHPMPVDIGEVRKVFATVFETDRKSKWRSIMEKRVPLRIGSMSDSFMKMDKKYKVTQELLKVLKFYRYPYIIFTRSDLVAQEPYLSLLDRDLASVQFSICGGNEDFTKKLEPGAPSVEERLYALERLANNGFWTTVRLNPLFPNRPDGYYSNRRKVIERFGSPEAIPSFPLFDIGFIDELKDAGVPSVLAGVVRLSPVGVNSVERNTGIPYRSFFDPEINRGGSDRHYSDSEIAFYYKWIQEACSKRGIRFNTCYIGNGLKDYYQYQGLWDNKSDCCDARSNVAGFGASSQDIPWDTRIPFSNCRDNAEAARRQEETYVREWQ